MMERGEGVRVIEKDREGGWNEEEKTDEGRREGSKRKKYKVGEREAETETQRAKEKTGGER